MTGDRDWADQPYVKVYRSVIKDMTPIYADKALFGSWVALLMEADAAYPAPAPLPRWLTDEVMAQLEEFGAIVRTPPDHYTLSGLAKERIAQEMGRRAGGLARVNGATRNEKGQLLPTKPSNDVAGDAGEMLDPAALQVAGDQHHQLTNRTEPIRDEPNPTDPGAGDPADDYWTLTGKYPNDGALKWIDSLTGEFGANAVTQAIARCYREDMSTKTLLSRAQDVVRRDARRLDRQEKVAELARVQVNRQSGVNIPLLIARHNGGQHADDADPACPACRRRTAA